jgi:alpha-amylase
MNDIIPMPDICLYFQLHQPRRLKRFSFFDIGASHDYEHEAENRRIFNRVADNCYLPAGSLLLFLIKKFCGDFRLSFSISGEALDQMELFRPDILEIFQQLAATGWVEFLNETDSHSLAFLFSPEEFHEQVVKHRTRIKNLFGQEGRTFRNTELLYSNALAIQMEEMGYRTILADGVDKLLAGRSPNLIYRPAGCRNISLLLRDYRLSDDLAFRFADSNWSGFPLTAEKYADSINARGGIGTLVNLFMDFETLGEHKRKETGIFHLLEELPGALLKHPGCHFLTISEATENHHDENIFDSPEVISWADEERDASAWLGNSMQQDAAKTIYGLEKKVRMCKDENVKKKWRILQTSDHFYYMSTKWSPDGDVHRYFNPYESPYAAYINYMNIVDDLSSITGTSSGGKL